MFWLETLCQCLFNKVKDQKNMFSQKNTFSSDIFSITVVNRKINYRRLPTVSVFFKTILFNIGIFMLSQSQVKCQVGNIGDRLRFPHRGRISKGRLPFAKSISFQLALVFLIFFQNICVQAQDTDKTIRKARERVAAGGKRETIKRLEVNQSIVRSDKVMNII